MRDGDTAIIGMECFSISAEKREGRLLLSGMVPAAGRGYLDFWKPRRLPADPEYALSALCDGWTAIAGPFHAAGEPAGTFDLSLLVGGWQPGAMLVRDGLFSSVVVGGHRHDLEVHSVAAVEVLLKTGDILASDCAGEATKGRWAALKAETRLTPFPSLNAEMESDPADHAADTAWYALQVGQNPETYRQAAVWLHARQVLFGYLGEGQSMPAGEWNPEHVPEGLPSAQAIQDLASRAARATGESDEDFARSALFTRNMDARQKVIYARWYGARPRAAQPS